MIYYSLGTDLFLHPHLATSMFRDRKKQFSDRLGWPVNVDWREFERDQYDLLNPIYVMIQSHDGSHAGSMRLMPTIGRTMINEHFSEALSDGALHDTKTWECTRFCVSKGQSRSTAIALFAAAGFLMRELSVENLVAVFDEKMKRIYGISGVAPELLGRQETNHGMVFSGRWKFSQDLLGQLVKGSGYSTDTFELGVTNSSILDLEGKRVA